MNYEKLYNYLLEEHGVMLLESDMNEIINIVNEMQKCEHSFIHQDSQWKKCEYCGLIKPIL